MNCLLPLCLLCSHRWRAVSVASIRCLKACLCESLLVRARGSANLVAILLAVLRACNRMLLESAYGQSGEMCTTVMLRTVGMLHHSDIEPTPSCALGCAIAHFRQLFGRGDALPVAALQPVRCVQFQSRASPMFLSTSFVRVPPLAIDAVPRAPHVCDE